MKPCRNRYGFFHYTPMLAWHIFWIISVMSLSKHRLTYFTLSCAFIFCIANRLTAQIASPVQAYTHSPEASVGAGVSTGSFILAMKLSRKGGMLPELYNSDLVTLHQSPVITFDFQQPIAQRVSFGMAISYQTFRTAYEFYAPTNGPSVKTRVDNGDVYTRTNIGFKLLLYHTKKERFNGYFGFRPGYTFWTFSTKSTALNYYENNSVRSSPSFQIIYGLRYFFFKKLGAGIEIGLGTAPYWALFNITYRL
jgi:hypothetical protein